MATKPALRSRLIVYPVFFAGLYLITSFTPMREYASILSGTAPDSALPLELAKALGLVYVLLHFLFYLVSPILLLAALIRFLIGRAKIQA